MNLRQMHIFLIVCYNPLKGPLHLGLIHEHVLPKARLIRCRVLHNIHYDKYQYYIPNSHTAMPTEVFPKPELTPVSFTIFTPSSSLLPPPFYESCI